jgi:hypothetical protein
MIRGEFEEVTRDDVKLFILYKPSPTVVHEPAFGINESRIQMERKLVEKILKSIDGSNKKSDRIVAGWDTKMRGL